MNGLVFKNEAAIREMFFIGELIFECELNESFSRKESNSKELFMEEGENGFVWNGVGFAINEKAIWGGSVGRNTTNKRFILQGGSCVFPTEDGEGTIRVD